MNDKELLYQIIEREVSNFLGSLNPTFRLFSNSATKYIITIIDPYVSAFMNADGEINTNAASGFITEEVNEKVAKFMKKFEEESANGKKTL